MNQENDIATKYRNIFKHLDGVDGLIEELDLPVRTFNYLKRNGINRVQQVLELCDDDVTDILKREKRVHVYSLDGFVDVIRNSLQAFSDSKTKINENAADRF
jgi:DUF438 domain-containing protein